ncbi:hypothetical protein BDZ91DRAFT_782025 [Kalaharituber pfeilii]|nr:hypothetical protein BDZ91DRAFT_782025 [Kalaharituber pfeilii]
MSSPGAASRQICIFCRLVPRPSARRRLATPNSTMAACQAELVARTDWRLASTVVPKKYGEHTGKVREREEEMRYFDKMTKSMAEPPLVVPKQPGSSTATFDLRMGRFYELEPVERIKDILAHDMPGNYFWPNPRWPPAMKWRGDWRDIKWGGYLLAKKQEGYNRLRKTALKILANIRQEFKSNKPLRELYKQKIKAIEDIRCRCLAILELFRMYMKQCDWGNYIDLLHYINTDNRLQVPLRRGIQNQLFLELSRNSRSNNPPETVWNTLSKYFKRPFTSESILFGSNYLQDTRTVLRIFLAEHGMHPHISTSNKAFAHEMTKLENQRSYAKLKNGSRPEAYFLARRKLYRQFTTHFDPERVNTDSIKLLLHYACDRDEVKRILNIALQATKRDPRILRKTQHLFLEGLLKFPIQYTESKSKQQSLQFPSIVHQNAENLADLCSLQQILRGHNEQMNRQFLVSLIIHAARYGNSVLSNGLLIRLDNSRWTLIPNELRSIFQAMPNQQGVDLITQRHRIVGNPKAWVKRQHNLLLVNKLRKYVGNSEHSLSEYIRALGRCGDSNEVWEEWSQLRKRGLRLDSSKSPVNQKILAAFAGAFDAAGDMVLLERYYTEIKASTFDPLSTELTAGILSSLARRYNGIIGGVVFSLLMQGTKEQDWGKAWYRLMSRKMNLELAAEDSTRVRHVFSEVGRSIKRVKTGEDLVWAEKALSALLRTVQRDGSVPGGCVSLAIAWPAKRA